VVAAHPAADCRPVTRSVVGVGSTTSRFAHPPREVARLTGGRNEPQGQHRKTLRGRFHWVGIGPAHCFCQSAPCAEHRENADSSDTERNG
jgi:hypothetical protein